MATRKVRAVSHGTAMRATEGIGNRRADHRDSLGNRREDPDLAEWSDDFLELLDFVCTYQRVPKHVLAQDVLDALTVLEYVRQRVPALPARLDVWEYELLTTGVRSGLSYAELARGLGLGGRQAVRARILRHEAARRGLPRNERILVKARKAESRERAWLAIHGDRFHGDATALLGYRTLYSGDDLKEEFDDLAEALEAWSDPGDCHDLRPIHSMALYLRELLRCLKAVPDRGAPVDLLSRLEKMTRAHQRLLPKETL